MTEIPHGWHRLQPGVYDDGAGGLRFDVSELLRDRGIEPTPEAVEQAARLLEQAAAELGLPSKVKP